jgi:hypothetical protein
VYYVGGGVLALCLIGGIIAGTSSGKKNVLTSPEVVETAVDDGKVKGSTVPDKKDVTKARIDDKTKQPVAPDNKDIAPERKSDETKHSVAADNKDAATDRKSDARALAISGGTLNGTGRPHLDLVRGLRREKMPDLALQYLKKLKASNPPPAIAELLPIEYARTWLDLAAEENDESKRNVLVGQARREIEAFLQNHPDHEVAPQANVELARLYYVQGMTQLRRARSVEDDKDRDDCMKAARPLLLAAANRYQEAAALSAQRRRDLLGFQLSAEFDQGVASFYVGETYVGDETNDVLERGKQFTDAAKIFDKIMWHDASPPIYWMAWAWRAQSRIKAGEQVEGEKEMTDLIGKRNVPAAAAGIRVARCFTILNNFANRTPEALSKLEKDTSEWLRDYHAFRDTTEGLVGNALEIRPLCGYNAGEVWCFLPPRGNRAFQRKLNAYSTRNQ